MESVRTIGGAWHRSSALVNAVSRQGGDGGGWKEKFRLERKIKVSIVGGEVDYFLYLRDIIELA